MITADEAKHLHAINRAEIDRVEAERRQAAEENRRRHPDAAAFFDDVISVFGGAKMKYIGPTREDTIKALASHEQQPD